MDDRTTGVGNGDDASAEPGGARRVKARSTSTSGRSTTKTKRGTDTPLDADTERRTRELEAEIADTREDLSETVEAIQERLRPSNIISEGTEAVRSATTQRARDMAETATDTAHDVVESMRRNPWPALLIGSGVAWLVFDRTNKSNGYNRSQYGYGRYQSTESRRSQYSSTTRAPHMYGEQMASRRTTTSSARTRMQRLLHENPLLVAAAAMLTGAAFGGVLPQTEKENELMGEARDQMVDRVQDAAREAADNVRDLAGAVQQVATQVTQPDQR